MTREENILRELIFDLYRKAESQGISSGKILETIQIDLSMRYHWIGELDRMQALNSKILISLSKLKKEDNKIQLN